MVHNEYYTQAVHGPYEEYDIGDFDLEEGGTIDGCKLAYATFGTLNREKDNAVLICTWYSGTSKAMEEIYTGKGRALDPEKYFIVIVNQIGNGLSSSPHHTPAPDGMANFPRVRIGDDVRAQRMLLREKLGIEELALVTGGSMGAEQTWEWAVRYPDSVKRAAPIAGTARTYPQNIAFSRTLDEARRSAPGFAGGFYKSQDDIAIGLRREAALWTVFGWSPEWLKKERWRDLGFTSLADFEGNFMQSYFESMDPNNLATQAWKWRHADVGRHTGGNLAKALSRIKAKVFVMPIATDHLFPVADCAEEQKLTANSELRVIDSIAGHLGLFGVDGQPYHAQIDRHLGELLDTPVR